MNAAYVGLGSNLGDSAATVERAIEALRRVGRVLRRSSLYVTKPWGKTDQPDFINAVALVETDLSPRDLLRHLKDLESELGRVSGERWGPRIIDLDLLTYGDLEIDETDLRVPHPQLYGRAFVLVPLAEIDARYAPARDKLDSTEIAGVVRSSPPPPTP